MVEPGGCKAPSAESNSNPLSRRAASPPLTVGWREAASNEAPDGEAAGSGAAESAGAHRSPHVGGLVPQQQRQSVTKVALATHPALLLLVTSGSTFRRRIQNGEVRTRQFLSAMLRN